MFTGYIWERSLKERSRGFFFFINIERDVRRVETLEMDILDIQIWDGIQSGWREIKDLFDRQTWNSVF